MHPCLVHWPMKWSFEYIAHASAALHSNCSIHETRHLLGLNRYVTTNDDELKPYLNHFSMHVFLPISSEIEAKAINCHARYVKIPKCKLTEFAIQERLPILGPVSQNILSQGLVTGEDLCCLKSRVHIQTGFYDKIYSNVFGFILEQLQMINRSCFFALGI